MIVKNTVDLLGAGDKMYSAIRLYGISAASKLEADAKRNAPWKDRTANARNSIQGEFRHTTSSVKIILSGNVDYFVYLENHKEKRYAILKPTIERNAPNILAGYKRVIGQ